MKIGGFLDQTKVLSTTFPVYHAAIKKRIDKCNTKKYDVHVYNDPIFALSEFKLDFYDLLLDDINMPKMDGFEFAKAVLASDVNVKSCFMSSGQINQEALRELYLAVGIGCFIIKPVTLNDLIRRVDREVD